MLWLLYNSWTPSFAILDNQKYENVLCEMVKQKKNEERFQSLCPIKNIEESKVPKYLEMQLSYWYGLIIWLSKRQLGSGELELFYVMG